LYAEKGKGCYCNGEKVCVSEVGSPDDSYVSFGSLKYFERTGTQEQLLQLASHAKWARGIGDFWSYHLLAQGKIDVMIEPVTKLWDVAALSVIVTEAGGRVSQMNGARVSPGMTSCIATNGLLHEEIVKVFN